MTKITVTRSRDGKHFRADDRSRCGSPLCGDGKTVAEAVGVYMMLNQNETGIDIEVVDEEDW